MGSTVTVEIDSIVDLIRFVLGECSVHVQVTSKVGAGALPKGFSVRRGVSRGALHLPSVGGLSTGVPSIIFHDSLYTFAALYSRLFSLYILPF